MGKLRNSEYISLSQDIYDISAKVQSKSRRGVPKTLCRLEKDTAA